MDVIIEDGVYCCAAISCMSKTKASQKYSAAAVVDVAWQSAYVTLSSNAAARLRLSLSGHSPPSSALPVTSDGW